MTYRRGRVSITVPSEPHPADATLANMTWVFKLPRPRIHIGHARTLLLGEMLCRELGCPFHLRLEGNLTSLHVTQPGLIDIMGCVGWLGIRPDATYRKSLKPRPDSWFERALGEQAWQGLAAERAMWAAIDMDFWEAMAEDFEWHPSLMIRGSEFAEPEAYDVDWPTVTGGAASFRKIIEGEHRYFAAAGLERCQATLPLVTEADGSKMSKSMGGVGWDCLKAVSAEAARRYLLATAACPLDPLAGLDQPLDLRDLDPTPHVWSWETWGSFIRQA